MTIMLSHSAARHDLTSSVSRALIFTHHL